MCASAFFSFFQKAIVHNRDYLYFIQQVSLHFFSIIAFCKKLKIKIKFCLVQNVNQ